MFDPPISSAANIFIIVAVCLIAAAAAGTVLDIIKNVGPRKTTKK